MNQTGEWNTGYLHQFLWIDLVHEFVHLGIDLSTNDNKLVWLPDSRHCHSQVSLGEYLR